MYDEANFEVDALPPIENIPPGSKLDLPINPLFVGRDDVLKQIANRFKLAKLGLSPDLYQDVRNILLGRSPLIGNLNAVFVDERISPWRNIMPLMAGNQLEYVESIIDLLHDKYNEQYHENVLALLLKVLSDRLDTLDADKTKLLDLAESLGKYLPQGSRVNALAITGMGGIGKTQVALEFAYRFGRYFPGGAFWLNFADPESIKMEIAKCGGLEGMNLQADFQDLELEEQVYRVRHTWREATPRLLIFDNCEEERLFEKWRPLTGGCRILLTSRQKIWLPTLGVSTLSLVGFDRAEVRQYLQQFNPNILDFEAEAIAHELGNLPLALRLAGKYLARYRHIISPTDYLNQLRDTSLLDHRSFVSVNADYRPSSQELNIGRPFVLSYDKLDKNDEIDKLSLAVLARMAQFPLDEQVSYDLLVDSLYKGNMGEEKQLLLEDALLKLLNLGLLEERTKQHVRIHRIIALFARNAVEDTKARSDVLYTLFSETHKDQPVKYKLQAALWLMRVDGVRDLTIPSNELLDFLNLVAQYADSPKKYEQLIELVNRAINNQDVQLSDLELAQLITYRATMWGYLIPTNENAKENIKQDYWNNRDLLEKVEKELSQQTEFWSFLARVYLHLANLNRTEASDSPETQRQMLLMRATTMYEKAAEAAFKYGRDPYLLITIYKEYGYATLRLRNQEKAQELIAMALQVLGDFDIETISPVAYARNFARIQEVISHLHYAQGKAFQEEENNALAMESFNRALKDSLDTIDVLNKYISYPTQDLAYAHYNLGDYQLEMSLISEGPEAEMLLRKAWDDWWKALNIARTLDLTDVFEYLEGQLEKYSFSPD